MLVLTSAEKLVPSLPVAIGFAAVTALLLVVAAGRGDPPQPQPMGFAERWAEVPMRVIPLPVKQVKTLSYVQTSSMASPLPEIEGFVATPIPPPPQERTVIAPPPPRRIAARSQQRGTEAAAHQAKGPDVCRGKGRIYTRGGKSWRCRR